MLKIKVYKAVLKEQRGWMLLAHAYDSSTWKTEAGEL